MRTHNLSRIITSPIAMISGTAAAGTLSRLLRSFTDLSLIQGNMGTIRMYMEAMFHILFAGLFGLLIAATAYKWNYMKKVSSADSTKGLIGSFLGSLVAGCPSCTITFGSYIGLGALISTLPRGGIELKIIGLGLMVRSLYDTILKLHVCSTKKPKN